VLSADTYSAYSEGVNAAAARDLPAFDASLYIYLHLSTSIDIYPHLHLNTYPLPASQLLSADTYSAYSEGVKAAAARDLPAFDASLRRFARVLDTSGSNSILVLSTWAMAMSAGK